MVRTLALLATRAWNLIRDCEKSVLRIVRACVFVEVTI